MNSPGIPDYADFFSLCPLERAYYELLKIIVGLCRNENVRAKLMRVSVCSDRIVEYILHTLFALDSIFFITRWYGVCYIFQPLEQLMFSP